MTQAPSFTARLASLATLAMAALPIAALTTAAHAAPVDHLNPAVHSVAALLSVEAAGQASQTFAAR
jgi:hypothetical protein